jgi:hypothetical protein
MIRFKKRGAIFETVSVLQNFEPLGLIARIPENVIEALNLQPGDQLIWVETRRNIIRLRLKRASRA